MTHLPHQQSRRGKASGVARLALSADKREQAIELHKNGMKVVAIASLLEVHRNTVNNWLNSAQ
jgi:DNA invertase Pin-like site-specific DNA recombinase